MSPIFVNYVDWKMSGVTSTPMGCCPRGGLLCTDVVILFDHLGSIAVDLFEFLMLLFLAMGMADACALG
jgi:hypothetical protein